MTRWVSNLYRQQGKLKSIDNEVIGGKVVLIIEFTNGASFDAVSN